MASYKDFLEGRIRVTKQNLSKAVSSLSAAANKRLKRMAAKHLRYIYADALEDEEQIAGHRKFGAKGKTYQQLQTEFKRLKEFFESGVASVTEVQKQAKQFNVRVEELAEHIYLRDIQEKNYNSERSERKRSKKEQKDLEQALRSEKTRSERRGEDFIIPESEYHKDDWMNDWMQGIRIYNYLKESKMYKPSNIDSDQMRDIAWSIAAEYKHSGLDIQTLAELALEEFNRKYGAGDTNEPKPKKDTSSYFGGKNR